VHASILFTLRHNNNLLGCIDNSEKRELKSHKNTPTPNCSIILSSLSCSCLFPARCASV
jgi:hypothetical protein